MSSRVGALGDDDADADAAKSIAFVCADCMTRSGIPHYSCGLHAAHAIPVRIGGVESVIGATWLKAHALNVNTESSNTVLSLVRVQHPAHTPAHQHQELRTVLRMRWWYRMIWMKLALQLYMHFRDIVCADTNRAHLQSISTQDLPSVSLDARWFACQHCIQPSVHRSSVSASSQRPKRPAGRTRTGEPCRSQARHQCAWTSIFHRTLPSPRQRRWTARASLL